MYWYEKYYGSHLMSLEKEINAPQALKQTRNNKIKAIDELTWIIKIAEQIKEYYKKIPEKDDQGHADLVQKLTNSVHSAYVAMDTVLTVSYK